MDIFIDTHQYRQINAAKSVAEAAKSNAERQADKIRQLERQLNKTSLASQAMWELFREVTGLTDERILAKMEEIDLRDGQRDGTIGVQILDCPGCGRKTNSRRHTCVFCGADTAGSGDHVFE